MSSLEPITGASSLRDGVPSLRTEKHSLDAPKESLLSRLQDTACHEFDIFMWETTVLFGSSDVCQFYNTLFFQPHSFEMYKYVLYTDFKM